MCSIGARASANRSELPVHDVGIDEADGWMLKSLRKEADDFEGKLLPQPDGASVAADHKIKLHGAETALPGVFERMRAHRMGYAAAPRARRGHVAAIRHVRAASSLIGLQEVGARDFPVVFRDKDFVARRKPVG